MVDKFILRYRVFLLISILVCGLLLRAHNRTIWPREGATFDEYAWTWLGMNLIQKGVPISWSPHPQYKIRSHYIQNGARFWLVQPYLEHPPLFGLVAGAYALMRGVPDAYSTTLPVMRELALILGVVSIYLVYLLGTNLYGTSAGIISSLFYAVMPTVVIGSRILQNENFFIPMFLGILYTLKLFLDSRRTGMLIAAAVLSGLVTLAKVPWFAATMAGVLILVFEKKYKATVTYVAVVLAIFSLFLLYGVVWDKDLFISLWKLQLNRYDMVFDSVFALMQQPYLVDRYYTDGWIYAGWIAVFALLMKETRQNFILIFGLIAYVFVYIFAIPNEPSHGWYRYPIYPFLAIAMGAYVSKYALKHYIVTLVMFLLVGLSLLAHTWGVALGFSYLAYRLYILWTAVTILPLWSRNTKIVRVVYISMLTHIGFLLLLSAWSVFTYNEQ